MGSVDSLLQKFEAFKNKGATAPRPKPREEEKEEAPPTRLPSVTKTGETAGPPRPRPAAKAPKVDRRPAAGGADLTTVASDDSSMGGAVVESPTGMGKGISFAAMRGIMPNKLLDSNIPINPKTEGRESTAKGSLESETKGKKTQLLDEDLLKQLPFLVDKYGSSLFGQRKSHIKDTESALKELLKKYESASSFDLGKVTYPLLTAFDNLHGTNYRQGVKFKDDQKKELRTLIEKAQDSLVGQRNSLADDERDLLKILLQNRTDDRLLSRLEGKKQYAEGGSMMGGVKPLEQARFDLALQKWLQETGSKYTQNVADDIRMLPYFEDLSNVLARYDDASLPGYHKGARINDNIRSGVGTIKSIVNLDSEADRDYKKMRTAFEGLKNVLSNRYFGASQTVGEVQRLLKELNDGWTAGPRQFREAVKKSAQSLILLEKAYRANLPPGADRYVSDSLLNQYEQLRTLNFDPAEGR